VALIYEKTVGQKSRETVPFNTFWHKTLKNFILRLVNVDFYFLGIKKLI
jgi:hypothetical protein